MMSATVDPSRDVLHSEGRSIARLGGLGKNALFCIFSHCTASALGNLSCARRRLHLQVSTYRSETAEELFSVQEEHQQHSSHSSAGQGKPGYEQASRTHGKKGKVIVVRGLQPYERTLVNDGLLRDVTWPRATSYWLEAPNLLQKAAKVSPGITQVYRHMGDAELGFLREHQQLPSTQPYQTIVEGPAGYEYCKRYFTGQKKVDSGVTSIIEFEMPQELQATLWKMQCKAEDGVLSHGLGDKGGKGLPLFNKGLRCGQVTWQVVFVKRPMKLK